MMKKKKGVPQREYGACVVHRIGCYLWRRGRHRGATESVQGLSEKLAVPIRIEELRRVDSTPGLELSSFSEPWLWDKLDEIL
jgi:hypothetical protein